MSVRPLSAAALALPLFAALSACANIGTLPPTQVLRYHLGEPIDRGTVRVEPLGSDTAPASLEYKTYAAAVETQLLRNGYALAQPGTQPQLVATVGYTRADVAGPPRRSPISIGIGGGSFGGGRGGGVGLGGGVGFPIGGSGPRTLVASELSVTIKRRIDQSPVWEGRAHSVTDPRRAGGDVGAEATKLATALFTGFPGESGRTIEVK